MTSTCFDQMTFEPPPSFVLEESQLTCGLTSGETAGASLIVRSVKASEGSDKESLFAQCEGALKEAGAGMLKSLDAVPFHFADGYEGRLISCTLALHGQELRQLHALRLDEGMLTSLALTLRGEDAVARERALIESLASAVAG